MCVFSRFQCRSVFILISFHVLYEFLLLRVTLEENLTCDTRKLVPTNFIWKNACDFWMIKVLALCVCVCPQECREELLAQG